MLAGGTDSKVNPQGICRFQLLGFLSSRNHIPAEAYRPFDELHDGVVLGEGAGLLILEERGHALKRGARIYGEIVGYGASSDFNYDPRISEDFRGKQLAMTRALEEASIPPEDIDFLLANGSGVPQEDIQEANAVREVFENSKKLRVTSVKPITGHTIYAAGGVEMAAALLALREEFIPPLVNLEKPAPECDLPFVKEKAQPSPNKTFLLNSFGFGGQNASLVVKK
jgi:3-oxoacyl-[acyl-carrier-protein] synthase II